MADHSRTIVGVFSVPCTVCGAGKGEGCKDPSGVFDSIHRQRLRDADDVGRAIDALRGVT